MCCSLAEEGQAGREHPASSVKAKQRPEDLVGQQKSREHSRTAPSRLDHDKTTQQIQSTRQRPPRFPCVWLTPQTQSTLIRLRKPLLCSTVRGPARRHWWDPLHQRSDGVHGDGAAPFRRAPQPTNRAKTANYICPRCRKASSSVGERGRTTHLALLLKNPLPCCVSLDHHGFLTRSCARSLHPACKLVVALHPHAHSPNVSTSACNKIKAGSPPRRSFSTLPAGKMHSLRQQPQLQSRGPLFARWCCNTGTPLFTLTKKKSAGKPGLFPPAKCDFCFVGP